MAGRATLLPLLAALAALPAAGRADPVAACLDTGGDLAAVTEALHGAGWAPVDLAAPLPADVVERALWPLAAIYLEADTGGASLAEIVAMQRRAVAGLGRKRDLPGSRTRLLARGEGERLETVLVTAVQVLPGMAELSCRFALTDPAPGAPEGAPPAFEAGADGGFRATRSTVLDARALAARLGAPVAVTAIVETTLRHPNEVPQ